MNTTSTWFALRNPVFCRLWLASVLSGTFVSAQDMAATWLMHDLGGSALSLSLMTTAASAPFFLFTLPAGALTDVVDPRRLLIVTQTLAVAISFAFAAAASAGLAGPASLLTTSFLMGLCGALAAPAWLLITTLLVRTAELDGAIAIDTAGYNVARSSASPFPSGAAAPAIWRCSRP